ncbi:MAG: type II secretion system protein [Candidatus Saccharimonadales bacterium]
MAGGKQKTPMRKGFTIIEVMIFLAVSGFTFLIAASFINGKEAQAEFTTGMNGANTVLRSLINNVANGDYPLSATVYLNCNLSSGIPVITETMSPIVSPGCALIGKVITPETSNNPYKYSIYSVAGCEFYLNNSCTMAQGLPPMTLAEEQPTVVSYLTQAIAWTNAISINKLLLVSGNNTQSIGAFGIFSSLPQSSGNILVSGAQPTQAVIINGSQLATDNDSNMASLVHNSSSWLPSNDYIVMCFTGAGSHKASITVGGLNAGGQLNTTLQMETTEAPQC